MKYCQIDDRWKNTIMGDTDGPNPSTNTVGEYGCYLCSLVSGLSDRGYDYDPNSFNELLKSIKAWVGPYKDYIDTANICSYLPAIFTSFLKIDPWNDIPKVDNLIGENLIVICRVNAKAIGGTGTHYVYLVGQQKGVALIYDPWRNVVELITKTWGNYGDVLGINIFTVKVKSTLPIQPPNPQNVAIPEPTTSLNQPGQAINSETSSTSSSDVSQELPKNTGTPTEPALTPISDLPKESDVIPVVFQQTTGILSILLELWKAIIKKFSWKK